LIVGAVYSALDTSRGSPGERLFINALRRCVEDHPILSAVIVDGNTEKPSLAELERLDLSHHIDIRDFGSDLSEDERIEEIWAEVSDEQFPSVDQIPPWKVVLFALPAKDGGSAARLLALFAYYHSHGDGKSGLSFHQTLFEGLHDATTIEGETIEPIDMLCGSSPRLFPPPMEEAGKLSLSWSYLLSPLLGVYLPTFLATMLGFRASAVAQDSEIWSGKDLSFDPNNFRTGLKVMTIDHSTINDALKRCKARNVSFTGLLNQLITRSLNAALGPDHSDMAFASQIVVDLRRLMNGAYDNGIMMNCVSAYNETIPSKSTTDQSDWTSPANEIWSAARSTTAGLAKCASTLHNQPIGLLQYLKEFRPWTLGQIGKKREGSYEISNLVVFDPAVQPYGYRESFASPTRVEKTIFSQPANAAGACLNFNLVSTKDGPLVMTVTWQQGVLDVGDVVQENEFVRGVCSRIEKDIFELAAAPL
jgi:hypothetical protein